MPGLDPGIHVLVRLMAGTKPGHDVCQRLLIISRVSTRLRACAGEIGLIPKM